MTTTPTNEMLALADELDTKLPVFHGRERDLIVRVVTALRLAATPARDVREALQDLVTAVSNMRVPKNRAEAGLQILVTIGPVLERAKAILSNLDAAVPAAGGDEVSVELMQRIWLNLYYNEEEAGGTFQWTLNEVVDWLARRNSLPTAAPPLQAPAHSDVVRVKLAQKMLRAVMTAEDGAGTLPAKESVKLRPKDFHKLIDLARECAAALTAPAANATPAPAEKAGTIQWPDVKVTNPDIVDPSGVPYIDCLLHRLLDAQQDINFHANSDMNQSLADASALIDEVETAIRKLATTPTPPSADVQAATPVSEADVGRIIKDYCSVRVQGEDYAPRDGVSAAATAILSLIQSAAQGGGTECCIPTDGEPSFVLLGRDPQAPELVEQWARDRLRYEPGSDKPSKAFKIAREMRGFKKRNPELGMADPSDPPSQEASAPQPEVES